MTVPGNSTFTVDLAAYSANLKAVRGHIPENCAIMASVKANGYGHGAVAIAERALTSGATMLGVATVGEGIELREAGIDAPILVLVQPPPDALATAIRNRLRLVVSDLDTAERIGDLARRLKAVVAVHCEIDTGMGRQGFLAETALNDVLAVTRISNVDIEGVATHFSMSETPNDPFTQNQIRSFRQLLRELAKEGIPYEVAHAANGSAVFLYEQAAFDMVRPGLVTYGIWPGEDLGNAPSLQPVGSWTTRVALVRDLAGGASISYGRTYRAPKPMRVALVPVGYADGYPFRMSNQGEVLIHGARCPIRGRVCMDAFVVDVSDLPNVQAGDLVTLMGRDGTEAIQAEELAQQAGTIPYEILTRISPRVERKYVS